tara:strand:+ start:167 stop:412 length:246 start_codon:yes stop_codon:yes gene_type:complete
MQKIVNIIAITSGAVSLAVIGSGLFVYVNRDSIVDTIKQQAVEAALGSLPDIGGGLPDVTGPASAPAPNAVPAAGLGIPNF